MTGTPPKQKPHGGLILLLGWIIFSGSYILAETMLWTNKTRGLSSGLFDVILLSIPFIIIFLPIMGLILFLIRRRRLPPMLRILIVTAPVLVRSLPMLGSALHTAQDPEGRYEQRMNCDLPETAENFQAYFSGGGLSDHTDLFYFKATPHEIQSLLESRPYKLRAPESLKYFFIPNPPDGWPNPKNWDDLNVYTVDEGSWFYHVLTNKDQTQAFIIAGCI